MLGARDSLLILTASLAYLLASSNAFLPSLYHPKRITISQAYAKTKKSVDEHDPLHRQRSKHWVVIVDDEEDIRRSLSRYLFEHGYQVTACADVDTALDVCQSLTSEEGRSPTPDAIVSDIRMPGKSGLDFLRTLRRDEVLQSVPVILLTAKSLTEDRIEGYKAGADAYLPKPFDPEELLSIIDNVISRRVTLNGGDIEIQDLKRDLDEIKYLLLEEGGGGTAVKGWVKATNVFLVPDEKQVLELLCEGLTNKEIAKETFLSQRRVEQHITSMFRKTGVANRTELVRWAVSTGNVRV